MNAEEEQDEVEAVEDHCVAAPVRGAGLNSSAQPFVEQRRVAAARVAGDVVAVLVHVERDRRIAGVVVQDGAPRLDVGPEIAHVAAQRRRLRRRPAADRAALHAHQAQLEAGARCASRSISGNTDWSTAAGEVGSRHRPPCRPLPSRAGDPARTAGSPESSSRRLAVRAMRATHGAGARVTAGSTARRARDRLRRARSAAWCMA